MTYEKFAAVADNHGNEIDPICEDALFRFMDGWKPSIVIHAGDNFNFAALRKKASEKEKSEDMQADLDAGIRFFNRYFSYGKTRVFLRGNHDERLWDMLDEIDGRHRKLAQDGVRDIERMCARRKVKMLPYDVDAGVYQHGKLRVIHGYASGKNAGNRHAQAYGNCIFGHTHSQEIIPVETHEGPAVALGIGCLLQIKQKYARANMGRLRHQNGWAYGLIFSDGTYQLFQAKRIGDSFYAAKDIEPI